MTIPIFPKLPGQTFSVHMRPTFATLVATAVSGREVRSAQQAFPLWEFELTFDHLKDETQNIDPYLLNGGRQDFTRISQLFVALNGQYGQFYFDNPDDNSRRSQVIGTGTGFSRSFTAVRDWGFGTLISREPVGGINNLLAVYINGTEITSRNYSFSGNVINFTTAPANGAVITADLTFFYLCRFLDDTQDYEQFMKNLWTYKVCKFRSIKL